MKKYILGAVFFLAAISVSLFSPNLSIAGGETPIYGGIPVYGGGFMVPGQVLIDKTVLNPASGIFVDNLGPNDPKYRPQQFVTFRIVVKNSGEQTLSKVTVTDKIPQFTDFVSGPGTYDEKARVLTFTATDVGGGASQTYELKVRTVHAALLPEGKNVVCPVNIVDALSAKEIDHDESQFCIEKQMIVPIVPQSGPEHWMLTLGGLIGALMTGTYLRKKAVIG